MNKAPILIEQLHKHIPLTLPIHISCESEFQTLPSNFLISSKTEIWQSTILTHSQNSMALVYSICKVPGTTI